MMSNETTTAPPETTNDAPEVEETAREMGWRPQEEWEGDSDRWMPADEFVARNERLKKRGDDILKADNARLQADLDEMKQTIKDLGDHMKKADQRALEKARREVEAKMREAVKEGDTDAFDEAQREMSGLEKEVAQEKKPDTGKKPDPDNDPRFVSWVKENQWYLDDRVARGAANEIASDPAMKIYLDNDGMPGSAFYEEVARRVRDELPERFGKSKRKAAAVEGGGGGGSAKTKWDQVGQDGKDAFKRFVKQGLYEDTKEGREQYAAIYLEE